jgi:hypothetical protein
VPDQRSAGQRSYYPFVAGTAMSAEVPTADLRFRRRRGRSLQRISRFPHFMIRKAFCPRGRVFFPSFHGDGGMTALFTATVAAYRDKPGRKSPASVKSGRGASPGRAPTPPDHGSGAGGAWQNKSETLPPGVIMAKWSSGQPASHDHDAGRRGAGLDHGSGAPGAWRARSENATSPRDHGKVVVRTATFP